MLLKLKIEAQDCQDKAQKLDCLAKIFVERLKKRYPLSTKFIKQTCYEVFGCADNEGVWIWKDVYEAVEMAQVKFVGEYERVHSHQTPKERLNVFTQLLELTPTHTRRTQTQVKLQQFSTPITIAYLAFVAARITEKDVVLEPSAGNGILAAFARTVTDKIYLNEIDSGRLENLKRLFENQKISSHNAEQIDDRLDRQIKPTVILLNPPFTSHLNHSTKSSGAIWQHLKSALKRLEPNGRMILISQESVNPSSQLWRNRLVEIQTKLATVKFSAGIQSKAYYKHGCSIDTRITVFDKLPASNPLLLPEFLPPQELANLLELIKQIPARISQKLPASSLVGQSQIGSTKKSRSKRQRTVSGQLSLFNLDTVPKIAIALPKLPQITKIRQPNEVLSLRPTKVSYSTQKVRQTTADNNDLYQSYRPQNLTVEKAKDHPADLVESAAMASVMSPIPSYQPLLPMNIIESGRVSHPQIEAIIRAGEAHSKYLGRWIKRIDEQRTYYQTYTYHHPGSKPQRRGFCLGDATGTGKTTVALGIILDNFNQGRTKTVIITKTDRLFDDFCKTWIDLGGNGKDLFNLNKIKLSTPITRQSGILFTTYSTIRGKAREEKPTRIDQICTWLGDEFDGVIAFDECHEMANAVAKETTRGRGKASRQGLAGMKLQNHVPEARVVYLSATVAASVENLGYLSRLGLWQEKAMPFDSREEFIGKIQQGGIAAQEIVSRDLKTLGLYMARSLSFAGVEYHTVEHKLTPNQIEIYSTYAEAFRAIYEDLTGILEDKDGRGKYIDLQTRSRFEGAKQEFFKQLITAMKVPTLITEMEKDLANGHCPVVQIVSTHEASLSRRLMSVPRSEYRDVEIDMTPREIIIDYLNHAFPVCLLQEVEENGQKNLQIVTDTDGNPIISREAEQRRDRLIGEILKLEPIETALDGIINHFGVDRVAEVTGRSQRLIRYSEDGILKTKVQERSGRDNIVEANAFQDGKKDILIFSYAGGTGANYHADLSRDNTRLRVHYLLEAGFSATKAVQGLGRTHRSNQKQPPVIKLVTSNVYGEKRFISSIARRLASLGALTKGQSATGSNQLFTSEDNLESPYARKALDNLLNDIFYGLVADFKAEQFACETGIVLGRDNQRFSKAVPMKTFLNRLLALPIDRQNRLFSVLDSRIQHEIELAKEAGTYETGVETITAKELKIVSSEVLWTHKETGAETIAHKIERHDLRSITSVAEILKTAEERNGEFVWNSRSENVALAIQTYSLTNSKTGEVKHRKKLITPTGYSTLFDKEYARSSWQSIPETEFCRLWQQTIDRVPKVIISHFYMLTGLLLPIWDALEEEQNVKIWRLITTDTKESLVGRVVGDTGIARLYRRFSKELDLSASDLVAALLSSKQPQVIAKSWRLKLSTVAGSQRYEVIGWKHSQIDRLLHYGCFEEQINYRIRIFIPVSQAVEIVDKLKNAA